MRPAPRRIRRPALVAGAVVAAFLAGCQGPPEMKLSDWVADPVLTRHLYADPSRMVAGVAPSGAVSVNAEWEEGRRRDFFIEQQRYGGDLVQAGVATGDENLVREGAKILDWGFARQGPDGDFPGTGDAMHSTSFMVESAARAALLLRDSGRPEWKTVADGWTPKIHAAARWMARPEVAKRGRGNNLEPYTHRYFLRAAALGQAAQLTGDAELAAAARAYADEGLTRQTPEGVNPEKGGLDIGYQAVGVYYAQLYYLTVDDPDLRAALRRMMEGALGVIGERVQPDGSVSVEGSTRADETGRSGRRKSVPYRAIVPAFLYSSRITGDAAHARVAERIAAHAWPAPPGG